LRISLSRSSLYNELSFHALCARPSRGNHTPLSDPFKCRLIFSQPANGFFFDRPQRKPHAFHPKSEHTFFVFPNLRPSVICHALITSSLPLTKAGLKFRFCSSPLQSRRFLIKHFLGDVSLSRWTPPQGKPRDDLPEAKPRFRKPILRVFTKPQCFPSPSFASRIVKKNKRSPLTHGRPPTAPRKSVSDE